MTGLVVITNKCASWDNIHVLALIQAGFADCVNLKDVEDLQQHFLDLNNPT